MASTATPASAVFTSSAVLSGDATIAAIGLAAADDDVQLALSAVETFMDDAIEFGGSGCLEFLGDFPSGFEEALRMAAADERAGAGEVFPVFQIGDVLAPIDRLDGDVLVGLADKEFLLEGRALEKCFRGGVPLLVGVLGEFG